jgi:sulfite reductase (NADPH) hemoprotein beta-component
MYHYDEFDHRFVRERVTRFRNQVDRRISGSLTEDEFRPLRLQNGLYAELHAYMLRVAIPYGVLNSAQLQQLAFISKKWDRGYGHFTTRQNIQFNWLKLHDAPEILDALAKVDMHAIQSSGNCIRNVTADPFAGAAADEVADPRPTAELIRQWSTAHPEFAFLPRKFKIAVTGSPHDRAAIHFHDIGLRLIRNDRGELGYEVLVGGGLGRTPMIAKQLQAFLPKADLLPYLEAVLHVYNRFGRRDNKYKARIKILVHEEGISKIRALVEKEFRPYRTEKKDALPGPDKAPVDHIEASFSSPLFDEQPSRSIRHEIALYKHPEFRTWVKQNTFPHRKTGYVIATISLKRKGHAPGDATAADMGRVADLAKRYSHDELRITNEQNIVLPHVRKDDLFSVYLSLKAGNLAVANIGLLTDIVACPGMDYCSLATARSLPIAQKISERFTDPKRQQLIGDLKIKISGCINACGHHHVGHIGILGLEKSGAESYQIVLGGDATQTAALGERAGAGFSANEIVSAIERLVDTYLEHRKNENETFLKTYQRIGVTIFRNALYPTQKKAA